MKLLLGSSLFGLAVVAASGYSFKATHVLTGPDPSGRAYGVRGNPPGLIHGLRNNVPKQVQGTNAAVPIPGTSLLFGVGLGTFVAWHYYRRARTRGTSP